MKNIIFAVVSLLLAFVYFLHALRCINSHNGTDDWIRIETVRNHIFFSGTCCRIRGLDFICFPVIALAYCGICILTVSPDILMLSLTAAVSAGVYLSAKLISGRKAASAAAQVLFLYELFPHFDTFFSSVPFIAFVLTSALIYIYISRPYEKMFTSALPLLFLSGFISGFGCIAYCLPAIIFLYIFSCVLKFRSDSEEYNPIYRGRAVIFGLIAFLILPAAGGILFCLVQISANGFNGASFTQMLIGVILSNFSKSYSFISPMTFALGIFSVVFCVYCLFKFKYGVACVAVILSICCAVACILLGNYLMLTPAFCLAMAYMFRCTNRHRASGILCPISACIIFIIFKAAEIIL